MDTKQKKNPYKHNLIKKASVVKHWNRLAGEVVEPAALDIFKTWQYWATCSSQPCSESRSPPSPMILWSRNSSMEIHFSHTLLGKILHIFKRWGACKKHIHHTAVVVDFITSKQCYVHTYGHNIRHICLLISNFNFLRCPEKWAEFQRQKKDRDLKGQLKQIFSSSVWILHLTVCHICKAIFNMLVWPIVSCSSLAK